MVEFKSQRSRSLVDLDVTFKKTKKLVENPYGYHNSKLRKDPLSFFDLNKINLYKDIVDKTL